jgi:hypothetical protein
MRAAMEMIYEYFLTAILMNIQIVCDMTQCCLVHIYRRFETFYFLGL